MDMKEIAEIMDRMSVEEKTRKTIFDFDAISLEIEKTKAMLEEMRILTDEDMTKMIGF